MQIFSITNNNFSMYLFKHPCLSAPVEYNLASSLNFKICILTPVRIYPEASRICVPRRITVEIYHPEGNDQFDNPGQNCFRLGQSYSKMDYSEVKKSPAAHFTLILIKITFAKHSHESISNASAEQVFGVKKLMPEEMLREEKMLPKPTTRQFVDLVCICSEYDQENDSSATIQKILEEGRRDKIKPPPPGCQRHCLARRSCEAVVLKTGLPRKDGFAWQTALTNNLLSDKQFGFIPGRSCEDAICNMTSIIENALVLINDTFVLYF